MVGSNVSVGMFVRIAVAVGMPVGVFVMVDVFVHTIAICQLFKINLQKWKFIRYTNSYALEISMMMRK